MMLRRIYRILQPEERRKGWKVICVVFLSALLDFVGLAVLLPVLYYLLEDRGNREVAISFSLLAMVVVASKSLLITFFARYQNRYLMSFYRRLSFSLFSSYYKRGLLFIREQGSNRLGYEVNAMCLAFSQRLLAPMLRMMGDGMLVLLVTVALLVYDGWTVMVLYLSFLPFMALYFLVVRKRVRRYGELELDARRKQSRLVQETFRGYTELEVSGSFHSQKESFLLGMEQISRNREKLETIQRLPLFLSELSVVVGLGILVAWGTGDVKLLVGIFAVASFRLLPALRGLLASWTQIQNASISLDVVEKGVKDYSSNDVFALNELPFEKEIQVVGVDYTYPDGEKVFNQFCCSIRKGEYVGFQGYSGVGKSTLFNLLLGFLEPDAGTILIDGRPLTADVQSSWLQRIGYVPQEVFIFEGTLAENIALGCREIDRTRVLLVLQQVSLDQWIENLPKGMDTRLGEMGSRLSGGQKQRIGIARALYKHAEILLLDEATSALDNETEREINETLLDLKCVCPELTLLSIAHRNSSLVYCERIVIISNTNC